MDNFPHKLIKKLIDRENTSSLRILQRANTGIDFSSNDYLGFATCHSSGFHLKTLSTGATGSRLITGNYIGYEDVEQQIAAFHQTEAALIFNSGYDANLGLLSSVPQRNDIVLYDALSHASIRDGIRLSLAKAYKFEHNDLEDLEQLLVKHHGKTIYVVTETVFSMDGDSPALIRLVELCEKFGAFLIVDEAHAVGVFGQRGEGLVQDFQLEKRVFARVVTFGKALGCHGAAVLGSNNLRNYLINFARSLIYTTALPPHSVETIALAYQKLGSSSLAVHNLRGNILHFSREVNRLGLSAIFVGGKSAIASAIIPGNEKVRTFAELLQVKGFDVRPILSPTVPAGQERLRFCLHSYNTKEQITSMLVNLAQEVFSNYSK